MAKPADYEALRERLFGIERPGVCATATLATIVLKKTAPGVGIFTISFEDTYWRGLYAFAS
jgi:hypothetical protein